MVLPQWQSLAVVTDMWWVVNSKATAPPMGEVDRVQLVAVRKVRKAVS